MATQAQILANRSNAQKSTGPRTPEGKAVVAQNAVKHGLTGTETVITGEDLGEFEFYRERMLEELDPVGEVEAGLAERIVGLSWRLKRAERLQAVAFDSLYAKQKQSLCEKSDNKQDADGDSHPRSGHRAGLRQQSGAGSAADVRATDRAQPLPDHGGTQEAQNPPGGRAGRNVGAAACPGERGRRERPKDAAGGTPVLRTRARHEATCDETPAASRAGPRWRLCPHFTHRTSRFTISRAKQSQFARRPITAKFLAMQGVTADSLADELRETKPICPVGAMGRRRPPFTAGEASTAGRLPDGRSPYGERATTQAGRSSPASGETAD